MPLLETIAESIFKIILEPIFTTLGYATGWSVLKLPTFGKLRLAPLHTQNRKRAKWKSPFGVSGFWVGQAKKRTKQSPLPAETTILTGLLTWIILGLAIWLIQT